MEEPEPISEPASSSLAQFPWVTKRDGRLTPFEADKISRAVFAATESLGQPDAFLARELTDAVLHFLAAEADGAIPTTALIAETVAKVVRELGHPAVAHAFTAYGRERATHPAPKRIEASALLTEVGRHVEAGLSAAELGRRLTRSCLRDYSLQSVFGRDLVAAHREGLLVIGHLDVPMELGAGVLSPLLAEGTDQPAAPQGLVERIEEVRDHVGELLAFDGPEYALLDSPDPVAGAADYARALRQGLQSTGLTAVVNLNTALPPTWAGDPAEGPLFAGQRRPPDLERLGRIADFLLKALASVTGPHGPARIDWHLSDRDFQPAAAAHLARLVRRAVEGASLAFVFDRPRRPLALAEGLDRQHPASLLTVGLSLPRLAEQPRLRSSPDLFLEKLGSLVRMALSAATQKRDFLRRHGQGRPALTRGFLLQRAHLVLAPLGLEAAVRRLHGRGLCEPAGIEFGRKIILRLREALRQDGAAHHLDTCLDGPATMRLGDAALHAAPLAPEDVAGATCWDPAPPIKHQLRASGPLHAVAERGTAAIFLPSEPSPTIEEIIDLLRHAWQKTDVVRLRLLRDAGPPLQLTAPWNE